jgi:hypothetical protein
MLGVAVVITRPQVSINLATPVFIRDVFRLADMFFECHSLLYNLYHFQCPQ